MNMSYPHMIDLEIAHTALIWIKKNHGTANGQDVPATVVKTAVEKALDFHNYFVKPETIAPVFAIMMPGVSVPGFES